MGSRRADPEFLWLESRRAWYLAVVMFLAYTAAHLDRQIIMLLVEPMKRDLNLTDEQIGALIGFAFAVSYTVFSLPLGYLADRVGRKSLLAWGVVFWSLMTAACGFAKSFALLGWARVGVGVGEAVVTSTTLPMVAASFPPQKRSLPMALCVAGAPVGGALAFALGGLIVQGAENIPARTWPIVGLFHAWQSAFLVAGLFGLVVVVLMALVTEPNRESRGSPPLRVTEAYAFFWKRPGTYASLFIAPAFYLAAIMAVTAWMPANLRRAFQLNHAEIGLVLGAIVLVATTAGTMLAGIMGHWAARAQSPARMQAMTLSCMAGGGAFYVISTLSTSPVIAIGLFGVAQVLGGAVMTLPLMAIQNVSPARYRSQATASFTMFSSLVGMGVGPLIVGSLTTRVFGENELGLAMSLTVAGAVLTAMLIVLLGLRKFAQETKEAAAQDLRASGVAA